MDEDAVKNHWLSLFKDEKLAVEIWFSIIKPRYSEKNRFYHTLNHIAQLLEQSSNHSAVIKDKLSLDLAIFFHDVIYDAKSNVNEEESAELFKIVMKDSFPKEIINKVYQYIIETKKHQVNDSTDNDLKLFIDFDMSILGSKEEEYLTYAKNIRLEYIHIEKKEYCSKRSAFLRHFANSRIFASEEYFLKYEEMAKRNLIAECEILEKGEVIE